MSQNKIDAKIELIRVEIQHEVNRLKTIPPGEEAPTSNMGAYHRRGRIAGLEQALTIIAQVEERVR